jgi:3'(2'), 5'-bisphosphate nucleotidase
VITEKLGKLFPDHAILTQDESTSAGAWYEKEWIWIVNPLDGTAEFAQGGDQFGVQIGLVHQGEPVLGVNYFPVSGVCYWGIKGGGAWREQAGKAERVITQPSEPIVLLKSSGLNAISELFDKIVPAMILDVPNSGGRVFSIMDDEFPFPLEGKPTLYVSLGASLKGTKKGSIWNYAATAVIAKEAGTILTDLRGQPLNFLEPSTLLPHGVVVTSDPFLHAQVVDYFTDLFSDKEE